MKSKKLPAVLIAALILMLAVPVFAAAPPEIAVSNPQGNPGEEITFTVSPSEFAMMADFSYSGPIAFTGLSGATAATDDSFIVAGGDVEFKFKIDDVAKEGEAYSFTLSNIETASEDGVESKAPDASASGEVKTGSAQPAANGSASGSHSAAQPSASPAKTPNPLAAESIESASPSQGAENAAQPSAQSSAQNNTASAQPSAQSSAAQNSASPNPAHTAPAADPLAKDAADESQNDGTLWIVLIIIAAAVIIAVVVWRMRKSK